MKSVNIAATLKAMNPFRANKRITKSKASLWLMLKAISETAKAKIIIIAKKASVFLKNRSLRLN